MSDRNFDGNFDLHNEIMNLPCNASKYDAEPNARLAFKEGHRDARHDAAELANSYVAHHESQDSKRLNAMIDWFLREGSREEICPNGRMKAPTREQVMAWLNDQIKPAEHSDVVDLIRVLDNFAKEAKLKALDSGQVYRTTRKLVDQYMADALGPNPIPVLRQALGDLLLMAKTFRMEETDTVRKAKELFEKHSPA